MLITRNIIKKGGIWVDKGWIFGELMYLAHQHFLSIYIFDYKLFIMKSLAILLSFVCIYNSAIAQISDDGKAVINMVIGKGDHRYNFWLNDASIPAWFVGSVVNNINANTTLNLSVAEKSEVNIMLQAAEHAPDWQKPVIDSFRLIKNRADYEELVNTKKLRYYSLWEFSRPIFIRHNTICFLYDVRFSPCIIDPVQQQKVCPSQLEVRMYVKKNNVWIEGRPWSFIVNIN